MRGEAMKRRGFLVGLLGLPLAALAAKRAKAEEPKKPCEPGCACGCGTVSGKLYEGSCCTTNCVTWIVQDCKIDWLYITETV